MPFLSRESIESRLKELISNKNSKPEDLQEQLDDNNAFTLRVGPEVHITDENNTLKKDLKNRDSFNIPSGQFALILTEEIITIPNDLMGFISIKAKIKLKGLINISGFHVDPGYKGRLIFSVYNAGPRNISLRRKDDLFLIWFSKLDNPTKYYRNKGIENQDISSDLISHLSAEIHSPQSINMRIDKLEKRVHNTITGLLIGLALGLLTGIALDTITRYMNTYLG